MSNTSRIKSIILHVLSDGQSHSFSDLKAAILSTDSTLLTSKNTLSAILYQMMKEDSRLIRVDKATYQYPQSSKPLSDLDVIFQMKELLHTFDSTLIKRPSYDMSTAEFERQKKGFLLSTKLHELLDPYEP